MDIKNFDAIKQEVQGKFSPTTPKKITTNICDFFGCKSKSRIHLFFHNMSYTRMGFGMTDTKHGNIWINPMFIKHGSEQAVKNLLAHEFVHLSRKELTTEYLNRKMKEADKMIKGLSKFKKIHPLKEEMMRRHIMKLDVHKFYEEQLCEKKAFEMYPIDWNERRWIGLKLYLFHPRFYLKFAECVVFSYSAMMLVRFLFNTFNPLISMVVYVIYIMFVMVFLNLL
jgi:predicted SprT family Zn-dependent metalloprotease